MLRLLPLLFLLTACFQSGLTESGKAPKTTGGGTTVTFTDSDSDSGDDTFVPPKAVISTPRLISTEYYKSSYGVGTPTTIGYGLPETINTSDTTLCDADPNFNYCISNERLPSVSTGNKSFFDALCPCKKPFTEDGSTRETRALEYFNQANADGYPFILQALQLSFSNRTSPPTDPDPKNVYTKIDIQHLSIYTAPMKENLVPIAGVASAGQLEWDGNMVGAPLIFEGTAANGCTFSSSGIAQGENAVGFLLNKNTQTSGFLTGLWIFERTRWMPYESGNDLPFAQSSGADNRLQLNGAFSTRASVYGTLVVPELNGTSPLHLFLPSISTDTANGESEPGTSPDPVLFTFGLYRDSYLPSAGLGATIISPPTEIPSPNNLDGAYSTPMMGKYSSNSGTLVNDWKQRVIVGICIRGTRKLYNGGENAADGGPPTPLKTYPLVHALKAEIRKIQVRVE